jgi:maltose O-acetyltransferase
MIMLKNILKLPMKFFFAFLEEIKVWIFYLVAFYPDSMFGVKLRGAYYSFLLKNNMGKNSHLSFGTRIHHCKPENITIGYRLMTNSMVTITPDEGSNIIIGDNVSLGPGTYLRSSNHSYFSLDKPINRQGHFARTVTTGDGRKASIIIEDDVYVGAHSVILSGAKIGKGSVLAAGSVVSSEIPPYSMVAGNPARVFASREKLNFSKENFREF